MLIRVTAAGTEIRLSKRERSILWEAKVLTTELEKLEVALVYRNDGTVTLETPKGDGPSPP